MDTWKISGGESLFGSVRIPGAKNSVLPLMAASLLCNGTVTLSDVPNLSDVAASRRILQSLGCTVRRKGLSLIHILCVWRQGESQADHQKTD